MTTELQQWQKDRSLKKCPLTHEVKELTPDGEVTKQETNYQFYETTHFRSINMVYKVFPEQKPPAKPRKKSK